MPLSICFSGGFCLACGSGLPRYQLQCVECSNRFERSRLAADHFDEHRAWARRQTSIWKEYVSLLTIPLHGMTCHCECDLS